MAPNIPEAYERMVIQASLNALTTSAGIIASQCYDPAHNQWVIELTGTHDVPFYKSPASNPILLLCEV